MTQRSNLKRFSSQTDFFHSTGHYNEIRNSVPPDPTMTVDGVTQVFNKIKGDKENVMRSGLDIPSPLVDKIMERSFSTESEKSRAFADVYVNIHPDPSWEGLTSDMYWEEEFASARESKSFVSTGKYTVTTPDTAMLISYHSLVSHSPYVSFYDLI